jgi:hypothetical protein
MMYFLYWSSARSNKYVFKLGRTSSDLFKYLNRRYVPPIWILYHSFRVTAGIKAVEQLYLKAFDATFERLSYGREWLLVPKTLLEGLGLREFLENPSQMSGIVLERHDEQQG